MALRLMVEGCSEKVWEFVDSIKVIPQWRFYSGSKVSIGGDELRIDYFFDENPYIKMKPSVTTRQVSKLAITSEKGEKIEIILLDAQVVKMGNGMTYVQGKNFDIFAQPKKRINS